MLLLHAGEHLKDLILVLWRGCLDVGGYPMGRGGAHVFYSMQLIDGWRRTVPPMALIALPFDVVPLRVTIYFLGAIGAMEESFEDAFL